MLRAIVRGDGGRFRTRSVDPRRASRDARTFRPGDPSPPRRGSAGNGPVERVSCGSKNSLNCRADLLIFGDVLLQTLYTLLGETVEADPALGLRNAPFTGHPAFHEHALQGRVERALLGLQYFTGKLMDPL